ncbi:hypothetical protein M9Y10_015354 [Tritrichomonas musculus]|uniref:DUF3447 domain-containing protein n=1 Tax=Tritrichomonas musculus TaxID=1915356 RepID=A0ABR2L2X4_9EUKA
MTETKKSQKYLDMMKNIQENILLFLEEEANSEENFRILEDLFESTKIKENQYELLSFLHLISKISKNCHRYQNFFNKIEQILQIFNEDIKKYFSNSEIFNIFKRNKRILLFLIEQKIIVIDKFCVRKITKTVKYIKAKYPQYFQPEIQPFINEEWFPKYDPITKKNGWVEEIKRELPENFYENRKKGENDDELCELIRNDMINEFVVYITRHAISINSTIQPSIYETNPFLIKMQTNQEHRPNKNQKVGPSLIEYAMFFGAIQIYDHLRIEHVKLTPSLWIFAIHGKNADMIHSLEENHVSLDETYKPIFYESLKCHHNDFAKYFLNNFMREEEANSHGTFVKSIKYYNFSFLKNDLINEFTFIYLCKYDYCAIVQILLENKDFSPNKKRILKNNC